MAEMLKDVEIQKIQDEKRKELDRFTDTIISLMIEKGYIEDAGYINYSLSLKTDFFKNKRVIAQ